MGISEDIRQKLIATFKTEQREHVQEITAGLLLLEKKPRGKKRQEILDEVFRAAHSLKGSARSVGISGIESLGHSLEELLLPAKEGRLTFTPELFDLLYQALDSVDLVVEQIDAIERLAEQSKQATSQVKSILNEIQRATNTAVMATEEGSKGVDAGVQRTNETGVTIEQLVGSMSENANAAQQIVASAQQQSTGMEQIALAMQNINQATVQNLASTRQTEKSAQDLTGVAQQLKTLVGRYRLN